MADPDRRPTAEEIEELVELVRRDPTSPAFVDLGEAYVALGRPRDAIEIVTTGLRSAPDSMEGRVLLGRAHVALHQWKEAQAELLKVVKVDRANRDGFRLLGEVLLRRADYERALPVLQHAQNLDPANPAVLSLLKRARAGQPLDPPPAIPTPSAPRRGGGNSRPSVPSSGPGGLSSSVDAPTRVESPPPALRTPPPRKPPTGPPSPPPRKPASSPPPVMMDDAPTTLGGPASWSPPITGEQTVVRDDPTDIAAPGAGMVPELARGRLPLEAAPSAIMASPVPRPRAPVPAGEPVRPRVIPTDKQKNAAAASLRQSAAVGENYLNDLLTGGLLDVPGVKVPEVDYDIRPDKRWGRSSRGMFITLFVMLMLAVVGGGGFYWYSEQQREAAIVAHRDKAKALMGPASFNALDAAVKELRDAVNLDKGDTLTFAYYAEVGGLQKLLYGTNADGVTKAITQAARDITKPGQRGYRELTIGRSAITLATLADQEAPTTALTEARTQLEAWLKDHDDDAAARWLTARALLASGERQAAHDALRKAIDAGFVPAMIDRADLLVDEGGYDEAMKLYDKALAIDKDHPLALTGRALARAERGVDTDAVMSDLNVQLDKDLGPRVAAYRQLALAMAYLALEDYVHFKDALTKAGGPRDVRFQSRVALALLWRGELKEAGDVRSSIAWYGKGTPESDPIVALVDASLAWSVGLPEKTLDKASKAAGVRAQLLVGRALLDQRKAADALSELDEALTAAKDNRDVQIAREQARAIARTGKERAEALDALEKLARKAQTKVGRYAYGTALVATGDAKEGRRQLEQSLVDVTEEQPNPLAYRVHTALAELDLAEGNLDGAAKHLADAREANPLNYLPAVALQAQVLLKQGDPDAALEAVGPVLDQAEIMSWKLDLVNAEALATKKKSPITDDDKLAAGESLKRAKAGGAPPEEVGRIAALVDPKLPEVLGVPAPAAEGEKPAPKPSRGRRRR